MYSLAKRFFASFVFACVLVGTGYAGMVRVDAAAQPPRIIMYQGRLLNSNGVPVSDATASVSFSLYTAASGGTCLWSNSASDCATAVARTVTLTSGLFSEALGDGAAAVPYSIIPSTVFSNNGGVYLEVVVNGETLTPRKAMLAAPYAMNADSLDGFDSTMVGATTSMIPITDAFGNLVITGAPQGPGVNQGSMYINPSAGGVAANEALFGVAVGNVSKFVIDAEGDSTFAGSLTANDFVCTNCLNYAELANALTLDATTSIDIGAFDYNFSGTGALGFGSSGQVTFAGNIDANNGLDVAVANLTVGTDKLIVSPTSGNISTAGTGTANFASNGQVTFAGNVDATNGLDVTTASLTVGGANMSIATSGLITTASNIAVNGGGISSSSPISIGSTGGDIGLSPSGTGLVYVTAGDNFAVGNTSTTAAFSVTEATNGLRIGDGANDANDPGITFFASDATDSGTFSFADTDTFTFANGKVSTSLTFDQSVLGSGGYVMTNNLLTVSGISPGASDETHIALGGTTTYSGTTGAGANNTVLGTIGEVDISASGAVLTSASGVTGVVFNQSTSGTVLNPGGYLAGGKFTAHHASASTVATVYGSYSTVEASLGLVSKGAAVSGEVLSNGGAFTTGYGGSFTNNNEGATRYGVFAAASGGATANYSGYFSSALVQVDTDVTADVMTIANAAGDLAISNDLENHGSGRFGDGAGVDDFIFTSALTNSPIVQILGPSLTTGIGLGIQRTDDASGTAFTGDLLHIQQDDVTAGASNAANIIQKGTGNSIGLRIQQDNVANQTDAAGGTTIGGQALLLETGEAASNDDIMLIRSNGQVVLAIETDGSVLSDNGYSAAGADYAEYFPSNDPTLGFYEMVCSDTGTPLAVKRCDAGSRNLVGVMSSNPGFIGNLPDSGVASMALVGMVGQIDTYVNAAEGAIAIGDPISTSSVIAGYGAKARGPVRIVGFALEALTSGKGMIKVLVQPQWYGGDVLTSTGVATQVAGSLAIAATTAATASTTAVDSATLSLRGSAWIDGSAQAVGMSLKTTVNAVNDYRLSVANNVGTEVASVNQAGDLAISGRLYPSDRGASQMSKYIYYDGSSGAGGDFMRTNSAGWATDSYDFAEMFPSPDALVPGEIVVFGDASQQVKRSTGESYSRTIAGIVSTRPGFLAGENSAGSYPIALAGRVPTLVSTENGAINIGDPLTTSTRPGYAMKATEAGPILGYAAEPFSGSTGSVIVYVNVSYYSGAPVAQGPAADNAVSQLAQDIENFDTAGTLNFNGGQLLAVGSMTSADGTWRLEGDGDIVTSGRLIELVRSAQGTDVETYAAASRQMTVQISGTVDLVNGHADVRFADIDPSFVGIVDVNPTYRALVTPYGATGALYVTNRTVDGFSIAESGAASTGVSVDWLVIATRRDYAPAPSVSSPIPSSVIDLGSVSGAPSSDASTPLSNSEVPSGDVVPSVIDTPALEAPASEAPQVVDAPAADSAEPEVVSDAAVDAPVAPDSGSDTVVSDTSTTEASAPAEVSSSPDAPASEPSAPAPSSDSSGGEASL